MGYKKLIFLWQYLHFPFENKNEKSGNKSLIHNLWLQFGHSLLQDTIHDFLFLILLIKTEVKLQNKSHKIKIYMYNKIDTFLLLNK